eukprot:1073867-Rhodomonas_salina.2
MPGRCRALRSTICDASTRHCIASAESRDPRYARRLSTLFVSTGHPIAVGYARRPSILDVSTGHRIAGFRHVIRIVPDST